MSRPFHVRRFTVAESKRWLGTDTPPDNLRRVLQFTNGWSAAWDLWAKTAISQGTLVPPRVRYYGDERLIRGEDGT